MNLTFKIENLCSLNDPVKSIKKAADGRKYLQTSHVRKNWYLENIKTSKMQQ